MFRRRLSLNGFLSCALIAFVMHIVSGITFATLPDRPLFFDGWNCKDKYYYSSSVDSLRRRIMVQNSSDPSLYKGLGCLDLRKVKHDPFITSNSYFFRIRTDARATTSVGKDFWFTHNSGHAAICVNAVRSGSFFAHDSVCFGIDSSLPYDSLYPWLKLSLPSFTSKSLIPIRVKLTPEEEGYKVFASCKNTRSDFTRALCSSRYPSLQNYYFDSASYGPLPKDVHFVSLRIVDRSFSKIEQKSWGVSSTEESVTPSSLTHFEWRKSPLVDTVIPAGAIVVDFPIIELEGVRSSIGLLRNLNPAFSKDSVCYWFDISKYSITGKGCSSEFFPFSLCSSLSPGIVVKNVCGLNFQLEVSN